MLVLVQPQALECLARSYLPLPLCYTTAASMEQSFSHNIFKKIIIIKLFQQNSKTLTFSQKEREKNSYTVF